MDPLILIAFLLCGLGFSHANTIVYYHILEEVEPKFLGNVGDDANITHPDSAGALTFEFLEKTSQHVDKFNLQDSTGVLSTAAKLDREQLCKFQKNCQILLNIAAVGISSISKIEVRVVVMDKNDNAPVFNPSSLTLDLSEGSVIGSNVPLVGATDEDMVGNNSLQGYHISPPTEFFRLIVSDEKPDGTRDVSLQLIKALDREKNDYFQIFVIAKDGGNPPMTGMLTVDIMVTDMNDNKPEFSKPQYEVTVEENIPVGSEILTVHADDVDIGLNAKILYSFSDRVCGTCQEYFNIDSTTGNITLKKQLEYAQGHSYDFIVIAEDEGIPSNDNQAKVIVTVKDTNNNIPQIVFNLLTGDGYTEVKENSKVDKVVAHIEAVDMDSGVNGEVNCTLVDNLSNSLFKLKEIGANEFMIVVNGVLDREDQIEHVVTVFCDDGGTPSLNNTDSFRVLIEDVNDHRPKFVSDIYMERISENTPPPKLITKVSAMDDDQGKNAEITYLIEPKMTGMLSMDPRHGIINAIVEFDRETEDFWEFEVYAVDGGLDVKFTSTAMVQLTIDDENDLEPQFTQDVFHFDVPEGAIIKFGNVTAQDGDIGENGRLVYHIPPTYKDYPFSISNDGELSTHWELDREIRDYYEFAVMARDSGLHSKQGVAKVTITVKDINDNTPFVIFPNTTDTIVDISYKAKADSLVTTIDARDADIGKNADLNFIIIQGNEDGLFKMDFSSGEILLAREIKLHEIKAYNLYFAVEDNGKPQKTVQKSLTIQVVFVNSTLLVDQDPVLVNNNILIVIAISCITVVLSTVIIIMICIIRRLDAKKRNYRSKTAEEMKIIETMARASNRSSSSKGSRDGFIIPGKAPTAVKKEVSFSMDDEQDSGFTFTVPPSVNGSQLMTFKSSNNTMDDPLNKQVIVLLLFYSK